MGYPIPGLDRRVSHSADGGYPIEHWMGYPPPAEWVPPHHLNGVPPSRAGLGGHPRVPLSETGWGAPLSVEWGTPIQTWDGGVPRGTPHPRLDGVTPPLQDWWGSPSLSKTGFGTPLQDWMGYPLPHQQSEHLLRGGRCASCVHAGGLSCYFQINAPGVMSQLQFTKPMLYPLHVRYDIVNLQGGTWKMVMDRISVCILFHILKNILKIEFSSDNFFLTYKHNRLVIGMTEDQTKY